MGSLNHCGIGVAHTLHDVYKILKSLQHRGQDAAGIATKGRYGIDVLRWKGRVDDFSLEDAGKILQGNLFIGHVRYSTTGEKSDEGLLEGAHPRFIGGNKNLRNSHEIARGASSAIVQNGNLAGVSYEEGEIDTDVMLDFYSENDIEKTIQKFPAGYVSAILDIRSDDALVFRDRYGIRSLWIGEKDGKLVSASEDVAIWEIGGKPIREVYPGEVIYISENGVEINKRQIVKPNLKLCFFEFNYLQSPSSSLDGRSVLDVRYSIGKEIAKEFKPDVDFISYIPHAPESMARGYSDTRKIPFLNVFYKQKMKRSFLGPTKKQRAESIGTNLFVLDNIDLKGKRIVVCDDSVVRLNNAPDAAKKLRERGVEYISLAVGTPPIGPIINGEERGCLYGIDMPPSDDFAIRRYKGLEEMAKASGFDDIYFISEEAMGKAHKSSLDRRCTYCIGGPKPTD
jgi:amidophosphoribosyltransferase